jgi:hypothetical protein
LLVIAPPPERLAPSSNSTWLAPPIVRVLKLTAESI